MEDRNSFSIHVKERDIVVQLKEPHRVISTCKINGGIRDDIKHIVIHQLVDGKLEGKLNDPASIHEHVSRENGIDPETTVLMLTAVKARHMDMERMVFRDMEVLSISTCGVESNAGRAGDPSQVYENGGNFHHLEHAGTICTAVLVNRSMDPSSLVEAALLVTEAKTSILQELNIPSVYSQGIATGTGTDQLCIASKLSGKTISYSGKHTKLGELMALSVRNSIKKSLLKRDRNAKRFTGYLPSILSRFGLKLEELAGYGEDTLSNPELAALTLSLAHLLDQANWGNVSRTTLMEVGKALVSVMERYLISMDVEAETLKNSLLKVIRGEANE